MRISSREKFVLIIFLCSFAALPVLLLLLISWPMILGAWIFQQIMREETDSLFKTIGAVGIVGMESSWIVCMSWIWGLIN